MELKGGTKIRLKTEIINKFDIPQEIQEGIIHRDIPDKRGAYVKHSNGEIFGWDYNEIEIVED